MAESNQKLPSLLFPEDRSRQRIVLIAEDDEQLQKLYVSALQKNGLKVILANSGVNALQKCLMVHQKGNGRDLLMLDINMPGINGFECLKRLKNQGINSPAILITGERNFNMGNLVNENCCLLLKPFSLKKLMDVVYNFLLT